jgi:hypothetical protein
VTIIEPASSKGGSSGRQNTSLPRNARDTGSSYPVSSIASDPNETTVNTTQTETTRITSSLNTLSDEAKDPSRVPTLSDLIYKLRTNLEEFSIDLDLTKDMTTRQLQTLLIFSLQKHFEAIDRIEQLEAEVAILKAESKKRPI